MMKPYTRRGPFETAMVREVLTNAQPRDLTRWLLKVRDALAEQDEAKRDSLLRAADGFLRGNNQSLELRGTGLGESRRRESPKQFVQRQRVVGSHASELTGPKKQPLRK